MDIYSSCPVVTPFISALRRPLLVNLYDCRERAEVVLEDCTVKTRKSGRTRTTEKNEQKANNTGIGESGDEVKLSCQGRSGQGRNTRNSQRAQSNEQITEIMSSVASLQIPKDTTKNLSLGNTAGKIFSIEKRGGGDSTNSGAAVGMDFQPSEKSNTTEDVDSNINDRADEVVTNDAMLESNYVANESLASLQIPKDTTKNLSLGNTAGKTFSIEKRGDSTNSGAVVGMDFQPSKKSNTTEDVDSNINDRADEVVTNDAMLESNYVANESLASLQIPKDTTKNLSLGNTAGKTFSIEKRGGGDSTNSGAVVDMDFQPSKQSNTTEDVDSNINDRADEVVTNDTMLESNYVANESLVSLQIPKDTTKNLSLGNTAGKIFSIEKRGGGDSTNSGAAVGMDFQPSEKSNTTEDVDSNINDRADEVVTNDAMLESNYVANESLASLQIPKDTTKNLSLGNTAGKTFSIEKRGGGDSTNSDSADRADVGMDFQPSLQIPKVKYNRRCRQ